MQKVSLSPKNVWEVGESCFMLDLFYWLYQVRQKYIVCENEYS